MPPTTQVNSATLIIGVTGGGKSSLAATLADYVYETHNKVLYYYNCDGGGYPAEVQARIAMGIIKVFRMRTRDPGDLGLAFETAYRCAQGYWPRRINPSTGEVPPGVEMMPPITTKYAMACGACGSPVKTVPSQALLTPQACPACRKMVTKTDMRIEKVMVPTKGFEDRGAVFFDGMSSMLSWELMELGQRAGKLELRGEEAAIGGKVQSGDLRFGGSTRSHVGFAQQRGEELAHLSLGIPNLMVPPVFTALAMEASDEGDLSIVGPKIAGRAKTDEAPQWFGNCLEAAKIPAEHGSGEQFVLYLSEFTDQQGRRHLLKHRGSPNTMPDRLMDPPNNTDPFSQFNLGLFFQMLDSALQASIVAAREKYPQAPGVPEGWVEFGEGAKVEQAQSAAQDGTPAPAAPTGTPTPGIRPRVAVKKAAAAPPPVATAPVVETAAPPAAAAPAQVDTALSAASTAAASPEIDAAAMPAPAIVAPAASPSTVGTMAPAPAPPTPVTAPVVQARPAGVAPPPGRPPVPQAARPAMAPAGAPRPPAAAPPATAPRPAAVAPRPPAAAPRPPTPPGVPKA